MEELKSALKKKTTEATEVVKPTATKQDFILWSESDLKTIPEKRRKLLMQQMEKAAETIEITVKEPPSLNFNLTMDFKGIFIRPNKRPSSFVLGKENKNKGLIVLLPDLLTMAVNPKLAQRRGGALYVSIQCKTTMSEGRKAQWNNEMQSKSISNIPVADSAQPKPAEKTEKTEKTEDSQTTPSSTQPKPATPAPSQSGTPAPNTNTKSRTQRENDIVMAEGDEMKFEPFQALEFNASAVPGRRGLRLPGDKVVPNFCYIHLHNVEISRNFGNSKYGDGNTVFITAESVSKAKPDKTYYEARRLLMDMDPSVYKFPVINFDAIRQMAENGGTATSSLKTSKPSEMTLTEDMTPRYNAMKNVLGDKKLVVVTSAPGKTKMFDAIRNKLPPDERSFFTNHYVLPFCDSKRFGSSPACVFSAGHVSTFMPIVLDQLKDAEKKGDTNAEQTVSLKYTQPVVQYATCGEDDVSTMHIMIHNRLDSRQCSLMLGIATLELWELMAPKHILNMWRTKLVSSFTLGYSALFLENGDTNSTRIMHLNARVKSIVSALPEYVCQRLIPITFERAMVLCYSLAEKVAAKVKATFEMSTDRFNMQELFQHTDGHLNALNEEKELGVLNVMESEFNVSISAAETDWDFYVMLDFGPLQIQSVVQLCEEALAKHSDPKKAHNAVKALFSDYFAKKKIPEKLSSMGLNYLPDFSSGQVRAVVFAVNESVTKVMSPFFNPKVLAEMKAEAKADVKPEPPKPGATSTKENKDETPTPTPAPKPKSKQEDTSSKAQMEVDEIEDFDDGSVPSKSQDNGVNSEESTQTENGVNNEDKPHKEEVADAEDNPDLMEKVEDGEEEFSKKQEEREQEEEEEEVVPKGKSSSKHQQAKKEKKRKRQSKKPEEEDDE